MSKADEAVRRMTDVAYDFSVGDRVRLNSGGPLMTIVALESVVAGLKPTAYYATCQWLVLAAAEPHIGVASIDVRCLTKEPT